jgi:hypothetical protein
MRPGHGDSQGDPGRKLERVLHGLSHVNTDEPAIDPYDPRDGLPPGAIKQDDLLPQLGTQRGYRMVRFLGGQQHFALGQVWTE